MCYQAVLAFNQVFSYPGGRGSDDAALESGCLGLTPSEVVVALPLLLPPPPPSPEAFTSAVGGEEEDEQEGVVAVLVPWVA